jgi:hypothetical protein
MKLDKKIIGTILGLIIGALATFGLVDKNDVCAATSSSVQSTK